MGNSLCRFNQQVDSKFLFQLIFRIQCPYRRILEVSILQCYFGIALPDIYNNMFQQPPLALPEENSQLADGEGNSSGELFLREEVPSPGIRTKVFPGPAQGKSQLSTLLVKDFET